VPKFSSLVTERKKDIHIDPASDGDGFQARFGINCYDCLAHRIVSFSFALL